MIETSLPEAVNYHLNKNCNFRCRGCYATFNENPVLRKVMLPRRDMLALVEAIAAAPLPEGKSVRKLTFAGGEPTLCPWLPELIAHASRLGLVTMLVTNGSRVDDAYLDRVAPALDWITVSIDSLDPETNVAIGRVDGRDQALSPDHYARIFAGAVSRGIRTKVNTVVNRLNQGEVLDEFMIACGIERWKILQVMPVEGQNDPHIATLTITREEFDRFVSRNSAAARAGIRVVPEPVTSIRGSYAMIDPAGRFFDSSSGRHVYSDPILSAGVGRAFAQVTFDREIFENRGGSYDFFTAQN